MALKIINVHDYAGGLSEAAHYFHSKWGRPNGYPFYYDAITHSSEPGSPIPKFFLLVEDTRIIGCYGLIANDFISRHDLGPWLACLFVEPDRRGHEYGRLMLEHGVEEAKRLGIPVVYLTTDHERYYEKYGWIRREDGYDPNGEPARIYYRKIET